MTAWLAGQEEWTRFFGSYERIVLVANSDAVDLSALRQSHGDGTLFVFFNKAYKVLTTPFDAPALLIARCSPAGANIVYRGEVADVLSLFEPSALVGIASLVVGGAERFSPAASFGDMRAGELDLGAYFSTFYPPSYLPTSGFALAVWLAENVEIPIFLAGFTARRSTRWKLFADHDWSFEQVVLRLLARSGYFHMDSVEKRNPYIELRKRFPAIAPADIAATGVEVLADRVESANTIIDRLLSLTRFSAGMDAWLRRLKPRTRKEKQATGEKRHGG